MWRNNLKDTWAGCWVVLSVCFSAKPCEIKEHPARGGNEAPGNCRAIQCSLQRWSFPPLEDKREDTSFDTAVFQIDVVMWLHKWEGVIFSTAGGSRCQETSTNHVNSWFLYLTIIHINFGACHRWMMGCLNQVVFINITDMRIFLFIVDVDIKQLLLCTGGHAVFLRAAPLVSVIKGLLDYKLLQRRNNCWLFLGIWNLSKGIQSKLDQRIKLQWIASWLRALWLFAAKSQHKSHRTWKCDKFMTSCLFQTPLLNHLFHYNCW